MDYSRGRRRLGVDGARAAGWLRVALQKHGLSCRSQRREQPRATSLRDLRPADCRCRRRRDAGRHHGEPGPRVRSAPAVPTAGVARPRVALRRVSRGTCSSRKDIYAAYWVSGGIVVITLCADGFPPGCVCGGGVGWSMLAVWLGSVDFRLRWFPLVFWLWLLRARRLRFLRGQYRICRSPRRSRLGRA